ncbi:hypothetical protein [Streptomyces viridochromogenes]|uniref:Uncharacterized protein n=1 Tax=Streptomyces viridochromogenes Tue57 TaxID=1160705 RepID=L8PLN2_STRVR|nr:hypothetical protein [Streptomyces viridochromogenes]ELS57400.1 hypothetical protein STVIR_1617 [Streptomyces viridochromogenes Tue57]
MTTLLVVAEQARPGWVKAGWTVPFTPEGAVLVDVPGAVVRTSARVASEPESQPADRLHVRKGTRP